MSERRLTTNRVDPCCPTGRTVLPGEVVTPCAGIRWSQGLLQGWPYTSRPIMRLVEGNGVRIGVDPANPCKRSVEFFFQGQDINALAFEQCAIRVVDGLIQELPGIENWPELIATRYREIDFPNGIPSRITARMVELYPNDFTADQIGQPNPDLVFVQTDNPDWFTMPASIQIDPRIGLTSTYEGDDCTLQIKEKTASQLSENVPYIQTVYCACEGEDTQTAKLELRLIKMADDEYVVRYAPQEQPTDAAQWTVTDLPDGTTFTNFQDAQLAMDVAAQLGSNNCTVNGCA